MNFDICIIGAGASGLAAAVTAAENTKGKIAIIEVKEQPGRKIAASGNGRCNLANANGKGYEETKKFFNHLGVMIKEEDEGRCYPHSENSADVVEALVRQATSLGVKIFTGCYAEEIEFEPEKFSIKCEKRISKKKKEYFSLNCRRLLIAAGGKSMPELGTKGDGTIFARKAGHRIKPLIPVLTAVETMENPKDRGYKGMRAKAGVKLTFKDNEIFSETGEVQFTEDGISGICVFNLTRYMMIPKGKGFKDGFKDYRIYIDFAPELSIDHSKDIIKESLRLFFARSSRTGINQWDSQYVIKETLLSIVRRELAQEIARRVWFKTGIETFSTEDNIEEIAEAINETLRYFIMEPKGVRGWNFAQVTKGGVDLGEIEETTMESKLVKGLYFAGEVTDYDGPCGGFNLQNAWITGIHAGKAMAGSLEI